MKRSIYLWKISLLIVVSVFMLTGCSAEEKHKVEGATLTIGADNEEKTYISSYQDTGITPNYRPVSTAFLLKEDMLYFVENAGAEGRGIYKLNLQNQEAPQKLPIELGAAAVWALAASNDGEAIYCMANIRENVCLIAYSPDGTMLWQENLDEKLVREENVSGRLICDEENQIYLLFAEKILLFDSEGSFQGEISCPGQNFVDMNICGGDAVYVTYQVADGEYPFLAEVVFQEKKLKEVGNIWGNGMLYQGGQDFLLLCDNSAIYSCEPDSARLMKLFTLADYNILSKDIQALQQDETGTIRVLCWEILNQNKSVEIVSLREAQEGALREEKEVITFLCVDPFDTWNEVVVEFNQQSEDYKVVLEDLSEADDLYAAINTRLVSKESADLLFLMDYTEIERYAQKGVLEDLTPYLEQSQELKKEVFLEKILGCFEMEGKVYGLADGFSVDTLMGCASTMGDTGGWTTEEFLNWIKQHPQVKSEAGLTRENLLEYCLKGSLDTYIDWEQKQALFEGEEFKKLLQIIGELEVDETSHWEDWFQIMEQEDMLLTQTYLSYFGGHANTLRDDWVYIGYPSEDGIPRYILSMNCISILSRSTCKEGAFAFLEYAITDKQEYGADVEFDSRKALYENAKKNAKEQMITINVGTENEKQVPAISEELLQKQEELLKNAVPDSYTNVVLRSIIVEEAQAYFQGIKGLDETCNIIQNRVQLYIDENG